MKKTELKERDAVQQEINERREAREKHDWQTVLSTEQGRRVIWTILSVCGNDMDGYAVNPYDTAYNCGLRAVGLYVRGQVKQAKRAALLQMEDEWKALDKQDQQEINESSED